MASTKGSSRFCPKCGRGDGAFIGMFCKDCFLKDHPELVRIPDKLEFSRCNRCAKIRPAGKWILWDDHLVEDWLKEKVKVRDLEEPNFSVKMTQDQQKKNEYDVLISVNGVVEGSPLHYEAHTRLFVRGGICNDDMLVNSDYYEAIIQVRFTEKDNEKIRKVQDEIDKALKPLQKIDTKAVVVKWVPQKNGVDAWIVSRKAAKAAALRVQRAHGGTMSVSGKLIGLDTHTSKTKNRLTFLVRVP
jgi:nonsense-mediated mRNA decay protein 3